MLNYIWAGLITFSFVFALWSDIRDIASDKYRNGASIPMTVRYRSPPVEGVKQSDVEVWIDPQFFKSHFYLDAVPKLAEKYSATLVTSPSGRQIRFAKDSSFPEPMATMRDHLGGSEKELRGVILPDVNRQSDDSFTASIEFEPVRFLKLRAISEAAFSFAKEGVTIALGLIGVLALWLGLMKIAEASGLIGIFVKIVQPILHPLFPQIPKNHPALGMIGLNLAANMLGLGNAATPLGLKAMEEMQKLNPTDDTATDPMVMLMAINTAGVQLVPPATLVAVLGMEVTRVFFPILIVTALATGISIITCKIFERLPVYRRSNPNLNGGAL